MALAVHQQPQSQHTAVFCRDIEFGYSPKKPVLQKLCMSVPQASIYSLLGASSSGKTTLTKIICGTLSPSAGDVFIFDQPLGSQQCAVPGTKIGFMPQSLALNPSFSIESTLRYFGQINRMKPAQISARIRFLTQYLELPDTKKQIAQLSGGQQRRVSLSVALIHSPPLIIADEPCVGIDPLLRYKIWNFFQELKQNGHTIIVTTHYIEETLSSDIVTYIRNGQLLLEQNPLELIRSSGSLNLEEAFYKLCRHQDAQLKAGDPIQKKTSPNVRMAQAKADTKANDSKSGTEAFDSFVAVSRRTWKLLVADRLNLFLMLIYPSVLLYMISLSFCQLPNVDVVIFNDESALQSNVSIAKQLVDSLSQRVNVNQVSSSDQISQSIMAGKSMAGFTFGQNFSECFEARLAAGMLASDEVLECASTVLQVDNSNFVRFWLLAFSFADAFKQVIFEHLPRIGANPRTVLPPIDFLSADSGEEIQLKFSMDTLRNRVIYI